MPEFFRKEAIEELRDPRGLEASVQLVGTRHWLAIAAFGVLIAAALAWAFFGRLDYRVNGLAVLLHQGSRVYALEAPAEGRVIALYARRGDSVEKGALLAELSLPVLETQIAALKDQVSAIELEWKSRKAEVAREEAEDARALADALKSHQTLLKAAREREAFLAKRFAALETAAGKGFASRDTVQTTRQELLAARQQLLAIPAAIARLKSDHAARQASRRASIDDLHRSLLQARGQLAALMARHDEGTRITSPADGTVVAVEELAGERVSAGDPVVTVETKGGSLTAYAFFPVAAGKKVAVGMPAFIGPSSVEREIHGVIRARVVKVSPLPRDRADLLSRFGNEALVKQILAAGAPIEAEITLDPGPGGEGFDWTASRGSPRPLTPGTLASSEVVVRRVPPFSILMPILGTMFGFSSDKGRDGGADASR
ncbi:MAG: NHLP bacteriocin system secretion protein [Alphaproteobacteria bacterium]|nr:MAG: NHLP bacteriocin system secretion protein [Alphaproteobacteria bacterium]